MQDSPDRSGNHQALIEDQFTQQAELFANAPALQLLGDAIEGDRMGINLRRDGEISTSTIRRRS
jgi:hypothetical protein